MARKTTVQLPALKRILKELGENIKLARLRRRFSTQLVAERAGMSRTTLRAIENGEAGVTIGAYANVLMCLGLEKDLAIVAQDDELGRKLQDADLPTKVRAPKKVPR
jgi:transcriptional regulator with XRE-family HTH domain